MAATISELLPIREPSPSQFKTTRDPENVGDAISTVYGGNTLSVAIIAASKTLPHDYFLYSALGNFLGPAFTDRKLHCSVRSVRTTKTFATRHVEVSQIQNNGKRRLCIFLTADFQTAEPISLLTFSKPPKTSYSTVNDSPSVEENRQSLLSKNLLSKEVVAFQKDLYGLTERFFECKSCPEGVMAQNPPTFKEKGRPTTQDHLHIYEKTSGDYFRSKCPLKTSAENVAALAFMLDMTLTFLPLIHTGRPLAEAPVLSSLEFAFRIFSNDVDLNKWHLRELSTITGGEGRTYTEAQVWDSRGKMICNMTQQSILRPKIEGMAKM